MSLNGFSYFKAMILIIIDISKQSIYYECSKVKCMCYRIKKSALELFIILSLFLIQLNKISKRKVMLIKKFLQCYRKTHFIKFIIYALLPGIVIGSLHLFKSVKIIANTIK